jgi:phosphoglycerate dehydrogenase-like enzyme
MRGFDLSILAYDPYVEPEVFTSYGVRSVELNLLLSQSDFVSLHCPLTEQTRHLINERRLRLMKPTSILINTSRGPVVDEPVLVRALTEGWIGAAGLDVLDPEPPNPDNPLLKLSNVVITPHIAGYSDLYLSESWRLSLETAIAFSRGQWPRSYVNRDVKPRWKLSRGPQ